MAGKMVSAVLAVVLAVGLAPAASWADEPPALERAAIDIQASDEVAAARQEVADAQAAVGEAQALVDRGALGFFEEVGATEAISALRNASFASYTHSGSATDATSLANMEASIRVVERCNEIRAANGLGELKITDYLMATSQSDANYSDSVIAHAEQFDVAENLAWNWQSSNLAAGVDQAFVQWYDNEKAIWDNAKKTGSYESKYGGTHTVPASAFELDSYELFQQYSDFYLNVGHYLNIVEPGYTVSGGAINTNGTNYGVTYAQNFLYGSGSEQAYSVSEYRDRLGAYTGKLRASLEAANGRLDAAKAALARLQSLSDSDIAVIEGPLVFGGAAKRPAVRVSFDGEELTEGVDYTLEYAANVDAGTARVTATGMGEYSGKARATFVISKAGNPAAISCSSKTVKLSKLKRKAQSVSPISVAGAEGAVSYAKVAKGSSKKISVDAKTGKVTVKKGAKAGMLKAKVKVAIAGNSNYNPLEKTVTVKVRVK